MTAYEQHPIGFQLVATLLQFHGIRKLGAFVVQKHGGEGEHGLNRTAHDGGILRRALNQVTPRRVNRRWVALRYPVVPSRSEAASRGLVVTQYTIAALAAATVLLPAPAHAEKWKVVGFIEPVQARVYVDTDSVVDREAFATADFRVEGDGPKAVTNFKARCREPSSPRAIEFTSDYAVSIERPFSWEKEGQKLSMSPKTLKGIFNTACKKPWEFWK